MQDKYVGDVGDFGKYGLLNTIYEKCEESITLGINWYYVKGEKTAGKDGRYIDYLDETNRNWRKYEKCFPELYSKLKQIVETCRNIRGIEEGEVLPAGTIFYSEPLPMLKGSSSKRVEERKAWFFASLDVLKNSEITFLDPDNGIETGKIDKGNLRAIKYAFRDEIMSYYKEGKSVIIYNHRDRKPKQHYDKRITSSPGVPRENIKVIKFKRYSVRHFVFLMQDKHRDLIEWVISCLTSEKEPYSFLFEIYEIDH